MLLKVTKAKSLLYLNTFCMLSLVKVYIFTLVRETVKTYVHLVLFLKRLVSFSIFIFQLLRSISKVLEMVFGGPFLLFSKI